MNINVNHNDTTEQIEVRKETIKDEKKEMVREAWREYYRQYRATHPEAARRNQERNNQRNWQRRYEQRVAEWEALLSDAIAAVTDATTVIPARLHEVAGTLAKQYNLRNAKRTKAQIAADKGEATEGETLNKEGE